MRRLVFAAPAGAAWPLPIYELALLSAIHLSERGAQRVEIVLATPEDRPLAVFGADASDAVRELLDLRGIRVESAVAPLRFAAGVLHLAGGRSIEADGTVALPRLEAPKLDGVPSDGHGFVPTDEYGWVIGLTQDDAAGDMTQSPVKQGGIAAQQADAAASAIAADAGADLRPAAIRPVLRGLLLTGLSPRFLRAEIGRRSSLVDSEPLWWPPAKIVGRYLAPFLAEHLGLSHEPLPELESTAVPIEVELDPSGHGAWTRV